MGPRLAVFAAALIPRLVAAWISFGAVDAVNNFRNFVRMLGGVPVITPYLPGLELVLWLASTAAHYTALPVMFPYKILPVVCDSLIAVALYDAARNRREGLRNGLLYAFALVPFVNSAFHPQWDALMLYPLILALLLLREERTSSAAMAGAAVAISIIWKPIAPPLLLLLVPWHRQRALAFIGGGMAAVAVYVAILMATGYMIGIDELIGIARYAGGGVQLFGLAYRPQNRLLVVGAALALSAFLYFRRRCTREEAVLLFFSVVLALSGLAVQYLCWIVPFAILCGRIRFLAAYGAAAGLFVVYFYRVPFANLPNVENLGTFAVLRGIGQFGPAMAPGWAPELVRVLGNVVVPLMLLGFAGWWVIAALRRGTNGEGQAGSLHSTGVIALVIAIGVACVWAAAKPRIDPKAFIANVERKVEAYDVVRAPGPTRIWVARSLAEPGVAHPIFNLSNVLFVWLAASTAAAAMIARR